MRRRCTGRVTMFAVALLAACGKDAIGPVAGTLGVRLTSPNGGQDSAIVVTVSGPAAPTGVVAGAGLRAFSGTLGPTTKFAIVGQLNSGAVILTIGVPDVGRVSQYSAVVNAVAQPNYQLRTSLSGYALSVIR